MSKALKTYEIVGRALNRNDRRLSVGTKVRLHPEDGDVLAAAGRVKASSGKATDETEDLAAATTAPVATSASGTDEGAKDK